MREFSEVSEHCALRQMKPSFSLLSLQALPREDFLLARRRPRNFTSVFGAKMDFEAKGALDSFYDVNASFDRIQ